MQNRIFRPFIILCFCTIVVWNPTAPLAAKISFIRDAEVEDTIRTYATPLMRAAGLEPSAINIYLVKDKSLNAFVAGGQKLFLNTGLLSKSEHAGQVIGVIAHEIGHIAGGHLSRTHEAIRNSSAAAILGYVLGTAAALGTGRGDVGQAIIMGGQQLSQRTFLQYSRTQEASADQAAMGYLDDTGQSGKGLREFMDQLSAQELLSTARQDPYMRTHPMTQDRIIALEEHLSQSPYTGKPLPSGYKERHDRMRAKLQAFLDPIARTLRTYKESDRSIAARYARAIAYYRKPDLDKALPLIDGLIAEYPQDPFFHELKGQMLFENARTAESLPSYQKAVQLLPQSSLLRRDLARVQIESGDPALLDSAVANLRAALRHTRDDSFSWRQLAIAYGRGGKMGESALAMAEEALLIGKQADALYHAGKAERLLPQGSTGWLHAQDILETAKKKKKK